MRKNRSRKPNANPMRVVAKPQFYLVTLRDLPLPRGTTVFPQQRVFAGTKAEAARKAIAATREENNIPSNVTILTDGIEILRPKLSF